MSVLYIFIVEYKSHESAQKKKLKSLKMDAVSESRQGALATVKYTLDAMKAKLAVAKNLRIKGKVEQPEPTCCSKNPFHCSEFTWS